jgi:hypothetical protein
MVEEAQETAAELAGQAQRTAMSSLDSQKGRAAAGLEGVAMALRQTTEQLRAQEQGMVAGYAEQVAERIESLTTALQEKSAAELIDDVENFARRRPEIFIGGALALGFLAARFLKSSAPRTNGDGMSGVGRGGAGVYGPGPMAGRGMAGGPASGRGMPGDAMSPGLATDHLLEDDLLDDEPWRRTATPPPPPAG